MCTLLPLNICFMCHVQELWLIDNNIGDAGLTAFAKAVESGALPQLEKLYLDQNQIGDVGMQALTGAVSKGALAPGAEVYLNYNNSATETGKQAMRDAANARGLSVYV